MRPLSSHPLLALVAVAVVVSTAGCVHLPPMAARAQGTDDSTPRVSDGVTVSMALPVGAAIDTTVGVLRAQGYVIEDRHGTRGMLRTRARLLGGDTSLVLTAQVIPVDLPDVASIVAISATYSAPSLGIRDVQVQHVAGSSDNLWLRLRDVADALRQVRRTTRVEGIAAPGAGLVLQADEGERRVRRNVGKGPFILKVDRQNGGSPDLVMGYEDLAPGAEIQRHAHLVADEILFIHRGSGVATLGGRESRVSAGGTVYIPRNVMVSVRNTGSEPLGVVFIFSKPGFEELMRENSVLEGQPVTPMSAEEREQIRKRHSWHTVYPP